jgi:DNA-binding beta-propeller fold protein YncE
LARAGLFLLVGLILVASAATAQTARHPFLFVQATMTKDIYVIDAETLQTVDRIPIGDYTDDVVGSPDGRLAFANAQISSGNPLGWEANDAGKVMAIDTATDKIVWSVFVDGSPHHLAASPDGARVYVPLFDKSYLLVLNARTGELLARWYSTLGNHSTEVSRDGTRLYVGNMLSDLIWVYDTQTGKIVKAMRTGAAVRPLRLDPDNTHIIYQLSKLHGFKVRDVASGEVTRTVDLPALPATFQQPDAYPYTLDHGLAVTPDGTKVLAAGSVAGYVAVYSLPNYTLLGTIKVGDDPNWIAVRPDSKIAFVSDRGDNAVSVIDLDRMVEVKQISAGRMPQRLSVIDVPHREPMAAR